jgi:hypothetical protein
MNLTLIRDYKGIDCSQGKLTLPGYGAETMERPWKPHPTAPCGQKGVSCVPVGTYKLVRHNSENHPRTWALVNPDLWVYHWDEDVPVYQHDIARTLVLIHPANIASELRGCIAPGRARSVDATNGRRSIIQSRIAMADLQSMLSWDDSHTLEIA